MHRFGKRWNAFFCLKIQYSRRNFNYHALNKTLLGVTKVVFHPGNLRHNLTICAVVWITPKLRNCCDLEPRFQLRTTTPQLGIKTPQLSIVVVVCNLASLWLSVVGIKTSQLGIKTPQLGMASKLRSLAAKLRNLASLWLSATWHLCGCLQLGIKTPQLGIKTPQLGIFVDTHTHMRACTRIHACTHTFFLLRHHLRDN